MKILVCFIFSLILNNLTASTYYYPEERQYTAQDRGFRQYGTPSLFNRSEYVLTFDDGPHSTYTPKLLDILKKYNVKATFFIVTERLNQTTLPILKRIIDEGHLVGNHSEHHDNSNLSTEAQFVSSLEKSLRTLNNYVLKTENALDYFIYRYPYGAYGTRPEYNHMNSLRELSMKLFGGNCLQFAFWDIDSSDWVPGMTSTEIFQNLKANEEGGTYIGFKTVRVNGNTTYEKVPSTILNPTKGGVILQHDIQRETLHATELFLEYAKSNSIEIKHLTETPEYAIREFCAFL